MAKEIINIHDFSIKSDSLYEIQEKFDANATKGYKDFETTKVLNLAVHNKETVAHFNEYLSVWDTGLFLESPLLAKAVPDMTAREIVLQNIKDAIIDPIVKVRGTKMLDNSEDNNKFWDSFSVNIRKGTVFNTSDPIQLLQVYLLVLRKVLTPKNIENHPEYINSQYVIENKDQAMDKESEQALRFTKAFGLYYTLKTTNRTGLISILSYIGLNVNDKTEDTSLDLTFKRYIENKRDSVQNTTNFIQIAEEYSTTKGRGIINIYQNLRDMYSKKIVELQGKDVYIDGEYLGSNFKNAARAVSEDKDLKKLYASKLS